MSYEIQGLRSANIIAPRLFIHAVEIPKLLSLEFPPDGQLRVRKVVTRSRERQTYKYPSWKMDRMIECESLNELAAARIYDCDPRVVSFHEQAVVIHYLMDGEKRTHVPDFVVRRNSRIDIDEIKDGPGADDPEVQARTDLLTPLVAHLGLNYRVRAVDQERLAPIQKFCRSVLKFGRSEPTILERESARRLFARRKSITWGQITNGCLGKRSRFVAARLLLEGNVLAEDCQGPLHDHTVLFSNVEAKDLVDLWAA